MNKRLGAALIAALLVLHSLLGFGAGTASAQAVDPQAATPAQAESVANDAANVIGDEVQSENSNNGEGTENAEAASEPSEAGISVQEAVYADPQPANILTSISLTDDEGNPVGGDGTSDTRIDPSEALNLNYRWELPNDHTYKSGSTFTFDLPSEFRIYTELRDLPLNTGGDGGESVGTFGVTTDGRVTVTFNRFIEEYSNISGTMTIRSELKEEVVKGSTEVRLTFPIGEQAQVIVLYLMPKNGSLLDKKGTVDNAAGRINWSVDLNTSLQRLNGAALSDPIPAGLTLDPSSVAVYKLNISSSGERTRGEKVAADQYTLNSDDGSGLKLSFNAASINEAYQVTYATAIGTGSQTQFINTATLSADGRDNVTASATVTVQRGELLAKTVGSYDRATQSIDWNIRYNAGALTLPQAEALLKDRFTSSQRLVEGSLKVTETATDRTLVAGTDYTVTNVPVANGRAGFDLQFRSDVNSAYTITYRTTASGTVYNSDRITNTVTVGNVSKSASQTLQRSLLTKVNTGVNYKAKTSSWRTVVNEDAFRMENARVVDTLPNGGLELVPGSLKVVNASGAAMNPADYTLTIPEGNRGGFTIQFNRTIEDRVTISYTTNFNQTWKSDRSQADFVNAVKLTWTENGTSRSRYVTSRFTPDNLTLQNGSKAGTYNAQTKELTWNVQANYNNLSLNEAVLSDTIQSGQRYVENSLTVNHLIQTGAKNGVQKGAAVDPADYTVTYPSADNGYRLSIAFNKTINSPYWITFKTTVDGQIVGANASNEAVLTSGSANSGTWSASVPIPGGSEYVSKTGTQQGGRIAWNVTINRGQSYVENARVIDTPTRNQLLDEASFRLYRAVSAADGTLSKGSELVKGKDYGVTVTSGETERFELTFAEPIRNAFILEYATVIYAADRETVSNAVRFEGTGVTTGQTDTTRSIVVRTSSGSGTGSGVRGALEVTKVDAADANKLLPGATFTLQDSNKRRPAITRTTDAEGRIVFAQLLYGNYILTETKAPEGYSLSSEPAQTVVIDSSVRQTDGVKLLSVENEATPTVPEQPGTPGTPEEPGTPGTPGEPENPTNPPVDPGTPTVPVEPPTDPGTPTTPIDGGTPETPGTPGTPPDDGNVPGEPTVPGTVEPTVPVPNDGVPSGNPSTPGVPSQPGTPSNPDPEVSVPDDGTPQGTPSVPTQPSTPPASNNTPSDPDPEIPVPDDGTPQGTPEIPATPSGEPEVPVPGDPIPQGVPPVIPSEPDVSVPDGDIPQGTPPVVPGTVVPGTVVPEEDQPTLPQTGEANKLPYVLAGAGLILFGFWLRRRASVKNH